MTEDEFRDKVRDLFIELNKDDKYDFLLALVTLDESNIPIDVLLTGYGCGACVVDSLVLLIESGQLTHTQKDNKVH